MKSTLRPGYRAVSALAAVLSALMALTVAAQGSGDSSRCCFSNWRYSGTCVVRPAAGQSCSDVLGDLNNPMSASSHCAGAAGGTNIRGGWAPVACDQRSSAGGTPTPGDASAVVPSSPSVSVTPDQTAPKMGRVPSRQPTFVTPVDPSSAPAVTGPSVITLGGP